MTDRPRIPTVLDPQAQRLGAVYAEALLDSLPADEQAWDFGEELAQLAELVLSLDGATELLAGHTLSKAQREAMVHRVFATRVSKPMESFLGVLAANHRLACLPVIAQQYARLLRQRQGRLTVLVRSAEPLGDEQRDDLARTLGRTLDAEVDLDVQVDESLLGGLLVQVGDVVYDASLAGELAQLRQRLAGKAGTA